MTKRTEWLAKEQTREAAEAKARKEAAEEARKLQMTSRTAMAKNQAAESPATAVAAALVGGPAAECVVCLDKEPTHALVPCGHLCLCDACSSACVDTGECPVCRVPVLSALRIWKM